MEISDAIDLYTQYLLVEKGLSKATVSSYLSDLKKFFEYYKNKNPSLLRQAFIGGA